MRKYVGITASLLLILAVVAASILVVRQNAGKTQTTNQFTDILEQSRKDKEETALELLSRYGYQGLFQEFENNNVNVINVVVNGISVKDYQSLLRLVRDSGNTSVARTMEALRKDVSEQNIDTADGEDGEESCH